MPIVLKQHKQTLKILKRIHVSVFGHVVSWKTLTYQQPVGAGQSLDVTVALRDRSLFHWSCITHTHIHTVHTVHITFYKRKKGIF